MISVQIEKKRNPLLLIIKEMRIKQWTKNLLVFAALLFSYKTLPLMTVYKTILGFFLFCFISSTVYILNDFMDREVDRNHPDKKNRPMASGELNPYIGLGFGLILFIITVSLSILLNPLFGALILGYFLLNVLYSFKLKHVVIMDVMVVSIGFVLRAIGGGIIIEVPFTPWFLLCIMLIALFLGISKRRHEYFLFQNGMGTSRKVLEFYSAELLDQLNSIVTTSTIICYSLFTFNSGHSLYLMGSIPFVIYGIFRYLYLIHIENRGGKPESILYEDKHILTTVILYAIYVVAVLHYFG